MITKRLNVLLMCKTSKETKIRDWWLVRRRNYIVTSIVSSLWIYKLIIEMISPVGIESRVI